MFVNEDLQEHLETSSTIKAESLVVAEWNMNIGKNIEKVGNYRYRPAATVDESLYSTIAQNFSFDDRVNRFYTDATLADTVVDGGVDDENNPIAFISPLEKERLLYSLEDCFGKFRPRSGINKVRYFENRYSHFVNEDMARRPRYYMPTKDDVFKYWTSYRKEEGVEQGIANIRKNNLFYINDAAPFVVYNEPVPTNRIVVKTQTHVGDLNLGPFIADNATLQDPFFGNSNKVNPVRWKIQYLDDNSSWVDAIKFDQNSVRIDGSPVVGSDGYVEIFYGLQIPQSYKKDFQLVKDYTEQSLLPDPTYLPNGTAYRLITNSNKLGTIYVVRNQTSQDQGLYATFAEQYGWQLLEGDDSSLNLVNNLTSPPSFINDANGKTVYRELQYVKGLRLVVETMSVFDSTFDLIELSPRLTANISDLVTGFNINKTASDLGATGLPVGQILASIGSLDLFDPDQAFFEQNPSSVVSSYTNQHIKFKFYEVIKDVSGSDYYVPIKTMYSDGFPVIANKERVVSLNLRDTYFYFESTMAPQILVTDVSLSYAISMLLDSIGYSNYQFLRTADESEDIIPYFYIPPDVTVAQVLLDLAVSTQSAMFFDELNRFTVMSKNYLLPSNNQRAVDMTLYGSNDFAKDGQIRNTSTNTKLANILDVAYVENSIFNSGSVNYTTRSIQRAYSSIRQASLIDKDRSWIYKPSLLWEVTGSETTKSVNEESSKQSAYVLAAIPLSSDLTVNVPTVKNHRVVDNTMDLGDGIYWIARYNGYFFANGEIIKYDAVQYSIPGLSSAEKKDANIVNDNFWVSSTEEYQKYFAKVPFNGKMYPTGLVRIYTEPNYETIAGTTRAVNGAVAKHGRGQFGTEIVSHPAGIASEWTDPNRLIACSMDGRFLFSKEVTKLAFTNVTLKENNDSGSVFSVADASLVSEGDFVRFGNSVVTEVTKTDTSAGSTFLEDVVEDVNEISDSAKITSIDESNNTITIDSRVSSLTTDHFVPAVSITNVTIPFPSSRDDLSVTIDVPDTAGIEVGMYVIEQSIEEDLLRSRVESIDADNNTVTLSYPPNSRPLSLASASYDEIEDDKLGTSETVNLYIGFVIFPSLLVYEKRPSREIGKAGIDETVVKNTSVTDFIKNIFSNPYLEESTSEKYLPATMQASALVLKGNVTNPTSEDFKVSLARDYISTIYKPLNKKFTHFGTRARVIGKIENDETRGQTAEGASNYYTTQDTLDGQAPSISGGSGGLAVLLNPETNNGYYFEIAALTDSNLDDYSAEGTIYNVLFYKITRNESAENDSDKAIPETLFGGLSNINVDDGLFTGQGRLANEKVTTVYDLAVEYEDIGDIRRFYLYLNNENIAVVDDTSPLPVYNNMGLFVRGNAKLMFENVYALGNNYSQNTTFELDTPVRSVFGTELITAQDSFQKYSLSGLLKNTYLSNISSQEPPKYNLFYDEFGTIMREASYFDIRYDKAYPALLAKIAPTFNRVRGFTTSGFVAGAYGAEFLVFNHTDTALSLDSSSGNYLRIQGVTFTQESQHELTVDEYFEKNSSFSDPIFIKDTVVRSAEVVDEKFNDIKLDRLSQGEKTFTIQAPYIQTQDAANKMMSWLVNKIMKKRKSVGLAIFPMPTLQLGDIVQISYVGQNGFSELSKANQKFVVYSISYTKDSNGPSMEIFLSEVGETDRSVLSYDYSLGGIEGVSNLSEGSIISSSSASGGSVSSGGSGGY